MLTNTITWPSHCFIHCSENCHRVKYQWGEQRWQGASLGLVGKSRGVGDVSVTLYLTLVKTSLFWDRHFYKMKKLEKSKSWSHILVIQISNNKPMWCMGSQVLHTWHITETPKAATPQATLLLHRQECLMFKELVENVVVKLAEFLPCI